VVHGEFEPLLSLIVDVGKPNQMTGDFRGRVETPVFALYVDAWKLQRHDALRVAGVQMPLQIQEFLVHAARYSTHHRFRLELQHLCQLRDFVDRGRKLFGVYPDTVNGRADRKWLSIPVEDGAAVSGYGLSSEVARVRLMIQKIFVKNLQMNSPRNQ